MSALLNYENNDEAFRVACEQDPEAWFPYPDDFEGIRYAAGLCEECPVRVTCLQAGMDYENEKVSGGRHGIWGGLSPLERSKRDRVWGYEIGLH